ncbi:hypothetical protein HK097_005186 [Rhizophlyctis rosea]|uniref:Uncharacterized protein n=1 Tax=Rhizophlyctis rosea TaxID=64517 RepID=A0AAD5S1V4_9FUNG|nr:hypothetical protein HK097_005186 [Rhizophlyctis rosea]
MTDSGPIRNTNAPPKRTVVGFQPVTKEPWSDEPAGQVGFQQFRSLRGQASDAALSAQFSGSNNSVNQSASPAQSPLGSSIGRSPSKRTSFSLLTGGKSFEDKLFYRPTPRTNSMEQKDQPMGQKDNGKDEKGKSNEPTEQKAPGAVQPYVLPPVQPAATTDDGEPVKLTKEQKKALKAERKQNRLAEQGQPATSGQQPQQQPQQQQQKKGPPANLPEKKSQKDMTKAERREKQVCLNYPLTS